MPTILGRFIEDLPIVSAVISNRVPTFEGDEYQPFPARELKRVVAALIDTGATSSAVDREIAVHLNLQSLGQKRVRFPNMVQEELRPSYLCALAFAPHARASTERHDWPDLQEVLAFNLAARPFEAVIGMDVLSKGTLTITNGQSVQFTF